MKKFSFKTAILLLVAMLITLFLSINVFAEQSENLENYAIDETEQAEQNDESATFTSRIYEWFDANTMEFFTALGTIFSAAFLTVLLPYLRTRLSSVKTKIDENMMNIVKNLDLSANNVANIVQVVNTLISEYNRLEALLIEYEKNDQDRKKMSEETKVMTEAIMEMLYGVYTNSRNLPQSVKEIVSLRYSAALKNISLAEKGEGKCDA